MVRITNNISGLFTFPGELVCQFALFFSVTKSHPLIGQRILT